MKSTKIENAAKSGEFHALTSSEQSCIEGGNTIAILGVPFLVGCIIGDSLWGDGPGLMEMLDRMR